MPIHPDLRALYPKNWDAISKRIRHERAGNCCEWCGAANHWFHPETGAVVVLTVAHLDHNPANNAEDNLAALCQACYNRHDGAKRAANRKRYQRWDQERAGQMAIELKKGKGN